MARLVTLSTLRDLIRERGEWNSAYITDAQLTNFINDACFKFYSLMSEVDPWRYLKRKDISVSSGTKEYDLPTDFYRLSGVAVADTTADGYSVLESFNWEERYDDFFTSAKESTRYMVHGVTSAAEYSREGNYVIEFQPEPAWTGTVRVEYVPVFEDLSSNSDSFDTINGIGEEWIICDVAIKCCAKEETDPAVYVSQKAEAEKLLVATGVHNIVKPKTSPIAETLRDLQFAVRNRGPWKREDLSDNQLTEWINGSIAALRDLVCQSDPSYFVQYEDISVASGTRAYNLPSDFYKLIGVDVKDSGATDGYATMKQFNWTERYDDTYTATQSNTRYHIRGSQIHFHPTPNWSAIVRLEYIPRYTALSSPTDTFDLFNHWHEWIMLDVCVKASIATGLDPANYLTQLQRAEQRITSFAVQDIHEQKASSTSGTLQDLQLAVRNRGNWLRTDIRDSQLTDWINSSVSELRDIICAIDPSYFVEYDDVAVSSGTREYALPADFFKVVGVDAYDAALADGYYALNHFNWEERYDVFTSEKATTRYHVRGDNLYLHPTPTWSGVVRVEYIPVYTNVVNPTDTVSLYNNWQEHVVLNACVKACAATGKDPQVYMAQMQKCEERIKAFALQNLVDKTTPSTEGTLRNLQLAIRARGGWTKEQINDSQLTGWINSSISALRDTICEVDNSYFLTYEDVAVSSGTREYDLPSDFFKVVGVDAYDSSLADEYSTMNHFNWTERYDSSYVGTKANTRYHIRGNTLHLHPTPTWSGTVRLEYLPVYTNLVDPSDSVSLYNNWQEYVILDCAMKCAGAVGTDPQLYMAQLQKAEQRITSFAKRNLAEQTKPSTSETLQNLQLAVRGRGGWSKDDFDDSQLTEWLNSSIAAFYDLVTRHEDSYFLNNGDISVVSGTKGYDLPSDFYKLKQVAVEDPSNQDGYAVLDRFDFDERYDYACSSQHKWTTRYLIVGQQIEFHPTPTWSGTVRLTYIPLPTALDDPADTFRFINHWQEHVILSTAIKACAVKREDPSTFIAQLREVEQRIIRSAEQDVGKPKTVVDMYRASKYHWW